jgi:flagellar biosynthesis protein FlhA
VFSNPQVLVLTAAILGILGLIPGMPNFVFLLLASGLGYMAWRGGLKAEAAEEKRRPPRRWSRRRARRRAGPT